METAIGVFDSPERAKEAVRQLLASKVPHDSIIFLTRSGTDAEAVGRELSKGAVTGITGASVGAIAASMLLVPGIGGIVFGLGLGAAALMGLIGAEAQKASAAEHAQAKQSEDAEFFRGALKEGRSLIVVRTESKDVATAASRVLDSLAIGKQPATKSGSEIVIRENGEISIIDARGRIAFGEGVTKLREAAANLSASGCKKVILNLKNVDYVDSSGMGEIVRCHMTISKQGGQLKLSDLNKMVHELLQATAMNKVFDIHTDEDSAKRSFRV
ncbi:MAG: STAS domain-containing protein [Candidatus Acidiferrum sp.]